MNLPPLLTFNYGRDTLAPGDDSAVADPCGIAGGAARECAEIRHYSPLPFNRVPNDGVSVGVRVGMRYGCIRLTDEGSPLFTI